MNPECLRMQYLEYRVHFKNRKSNKEVLSITPFEHYIRWVEIEVVSKIENELGWKKGSSSVSSWRGDCDVAQLKLYMYKKLLGYNDKDDGLSCLIRDGQLSREEALWRIESEGNVPYSVIQDLMDELGLHFPKEKDLDDRIEKAFFLVSK